MTHATIVDFLEQTFDEELTAGNASAFSIAPETGRDAREVHQKYFEFLDKHGDFAMTTRNANETRPLIWHETHGAAGAMGGDPLATDPTDPTENSRAMARALCIPLLYHHRVAVVDQLDWILSFAGVADRAPEYPAGKLQTYVRFLAEVKPLISRGIVDIVSDRRAYQTAPVNSQNFRKLIHESGVCPNVPLDDLHSEAAQVEAVMPQMVGLHTLCWMHDCDELAHSGAQWQALDLIMSDFEHDGPLQSVTYEDTIGFEVDNITVSDLVNIRLEEDHFELWRECLRLALQEKDPDNFTGQLSEGMLKLNAHTEDISGIKRAKHAIKVGLITGAPGLLAHPLVGLAIGLLGGAADAAWGARAEKKLQESRRAASDAFIRLATSVTPQPAPPPLPDGLLSMMKSWRERQEGN